MVRESPNFIQNELKIFLKSTTGLLSLNSVRLSLILHEYFKYWLRTDKLL